MEAWPTAVIAILSALLGGGGVVAFLELRPKNRRTDAEADKTAAEAWAILATNQSTRIVKLETRLAEIENQMEAKDRRIDELEEEIDDLRTWIENQGLTPPPRKRIRAVKA